MPSTVAKKLLLAAAALAVLAAVSATGGLCGGTACGRNSGQKCCPPGCGHGAGTHADKFGCCKPDEPCCKWENGAGKFVGGCVKDGKCVGSPNEGESDPSEYTVCS
eukprot:tig00021098_g18177.t1